LMNLTAPTGSGFALLICHLPDVPAFVKAGRRAREGGPPYH
jgi:hypothetical protein